MTRHFYRLASVLLMCAMLPLALGISLDFYLVLAKVTDARGLATTCGALAFALFIGCWFAFPFLRRGGTQTRASGRPTQLQRRAGVGA